MKYSFKVKQYDQNDCGIASLSSVCRFYGANYSLSSLRIMSNQGTNGISIRGIKELAEQIGIKCSAYKGNLQALSSINLPSILHVTQSEGNSHFFVLYKVKKNIFKIMDPALGRFIKYKEIDLLKIWSGYLLIFEMGSNPLLSGNNSTIFSFIKKIIKTHLGRFVGLITSTLILICLGIGFAIINKFMIDLITSSSLSESFDLLFGSLILISLLILILSYTKTKLTIDLGLDINKVLNQKLLKDIIKIDYKHYGFLKFGEIRTRFSDIDNVRGFIMEFLIGGFGAALSIILSLSAIFWINVKTGLISLLIIPVELLIYNFYLRSVDLKIASVKEASSRYESYVNDLWKSLEFIKLNNHPFYSESKINERVDRVISAIKGSSIISLKYFTAGDIVFRVFYLTVLFTALIISLESVNGAGNLVALISLFSILSVSVSKISEILKAFRDGKISALRLKDFELLSQDSEPTTFVIPKDLSIKKLKVNSLNINSVSFWFNPNLKLFENLCIDFRIGKINLIKGKNGAGKSTLLKILLLLYKPTTGNITINGTDINVFKNSLGKIIAYVPQEPKLLSGTFADNLGITSKEQLNSTTIEILERLKLTDLLNRLPRGIFSDIMLNTQLVSKGELQKIVFAAALIKDSSVIILDESSSSADTDSKKIFRDEILRLKKRGKTIIMVSHSPEDDAISDYIIEI